MELRICDFCDFQFKKNTGHMCWCPDCSKPHPMCDDCYLKYVDSGEIKPTVININDITEENRKRMT